MTHKGGVVYFLLVSVGVGVMSNSSLMFKTFTFAMMMLAINGCVLFSKPDCCDHEELCDLNTEDAGIYNKTRKLAVDESHEIQICGCNPWNLSGIEVKANEVYSFKVSEVADSEWFDGKESDPITGWESKTRNWVGEIFGGLKRSNSTNWYALVGSVGREKGNDFAILENSPQEITSEFSGQLLFFANDKEGRYFNNRGTLRLQITRLK